MVAIVRFMLSPRVEVCAYTIGDATLGVNTPGGKLSKGTTLRAVRVPDELWTAALEATAERGETVSDVIRRALREYVEGEGGGDE
jgi:hypothetical protein